jgi:hypothetical protein
VKDTYWPWKLCKEKERTMKELRMRREKDREGKGGGRRNYKNSVVYPE